MVIAAATETPRGERSHAVGAYVAEGHSRDWLLLAHLVPVRVPVTLS